LVRLISADEIVFLGPGSEWFWTAVSGMVLAVTFFSIYRQLRMQRAANALLAMESLVRRWESRELVMTRLEAALAMRYERDPGHTNMAIIKLLDFLTDVINLWDRGLLEEGDVVPTWGISTTVWLALVQPYLAVQRGKPGESRYRILQQFADHVERMNHRSWRRRTRWEIDLPVIDDTNRQEWLDEAIRRGIQTLELLDQVEARHIPRPPEPELVNPAMPMPAGAE
jgi:hypothetical protein